MSYPVSYTRALTLLRNSALVLGLVLGLVACDSFGNKTDLGFIKTPTVTVPTVSYVPIFPNLTGFSNPIHVYAGYDQLLYVVDNFPNAGDNEVKSVIYAYDGAFNRIGTFTVPADMIVNSVIQDRKLDLLCTGRKRVEREGRSYFLPAIFRISMQKRVNGVLTLSLNHAEVTRTMIYPFFIRESITRLNFQDSAYCLGINLNGIGILPDNRYYVTCSSKFPTPAVIRSNFPNNSVLRCNMIDTSWTSLSISTGNSTSNEFFAQPFGISTYVQPPQSFNLPEGDEEDFFFSSIDPNSNLKVQLIDVTAGADGPPTASLRILPDNDPEIADGFLYTADRFRAPKGIAYAGDGTRYLFVVDKDSVYQFTSTGYEGVNPPPGSAQRRQIRVSFGGTGDDIFKFRNPQSVTYVSLGRGSRGGYLVVCDTGNKKVKVFRLTTDILL